MKIENNINIDAKLIESKLGKDLIYLGNDNFTCGIYKTGSLNLDKITGINGIPKGRIIEIFGNESSAKTTISLQMLAQGQKDGYKVMFIDVEHTFNGKYAKNIGIDLDNILIAKPKTGEQVFEILEFVIKNKIADIVVVDSVAAMVPNDEYENDINSQQMGLHARLMSKGLRKIQTLLSNSETTIIFLNQIREKIGIIFGNNETTTGGRALRFYSTMRIECKKAEIIKNLNNKIGIKVRINIIKNKISAPYTTTFLDIIFGQGFKQSNEIIDIAIEKGIIKKNGSWYSLLKDDRKLAQGKEQLREKLTEDIELFNQIKSETLNSI